MLERLRTQIDELTKRLEIARLIDKYKKEYAECRPECIHLLFQNYSTKYNLLNCFEKYIECPTDYNIKALENKLNETKFEYFINLQSILFESGDPLNY
jgi:hypothetical protein